MKRLMIALIFAVSVIMNGWGGQAEDEAWLKKHIKTSLAEQNAQIALVNQKLTNVTNDYDIFKTLVNEVIVPTKVTNVTVRGKARIERVKCISERQQKIARICKILEMPEIDEMLEKYLGLDSKKVRRMFEDEYKRKIAEHKTYTEELYALNAEELQKKTDIHNKYKSGRTADADQIKSKIAGLSKKRNEVDSKHAKGYCSLAGSGCNCKDSIQKLDVQINRLCSELNTIKRIDEAAGEHNEINKTSEKYAHRRDDIHANVNFRQDLDTVITKYGSYIDNLELEFKQQVNALNLELEKIHVKCESLQRLMDDVKYIDLTAIASMRKAHVENMLNKGGMENEAIQVKIDEWARKYEKRRTEDRTHIINHNVRMTTSEPSNPIGHEILEHGVFGFKFGEIVPSEHYALTKPWRGKYNEIEFRDCNEKKQFSLIRVIWTYGANRPSRQELRSEMSELCKILNMKYGFDIHPGHTAAYYHSKDGNWYVGISYVDNDRMFFDIKYKRLQPEH